MLIAGFALPLSIVRRNLRASVPDRALTPQETKDLLAAVADVEPKLRGRTLIVFTDYECPACEQLERHLSEWGVQPWMKGTRVVYLNFPLPMHHDAFAKAVSVESLRGGHGFAEVRRRLSSPDAWAGATPVPAIFTRAEIDAKKASRLRPDARARVERHLRLAKELHLPGTPSCVILSSKGSATLLSSASRIPDLLSVAEEGS